jgi:hypothetical protein
MDCLRSFVLSAPCEYSLPVRRVLFGPFSPVIHGSDDFAERFPSLGGSVLAVKRVSRKDFSGADIGFFHLSPSQQEYLWTGSWPGEVGGVKMTMIEPADKPEWGRMKGASARSKGIHHPSKARG